MRKGNNNELVRRNVTLPKEFADRMAALRDATGIQSDSELIRRAVSLLEKVAASEANGEVIKVHHQDTGETERLSVLM